VEYIKNNTNSTSAKNEKHGFVNNFTTFKL